MLEVNAAYQIYGLYQYYVNRRYLHTYNVDTAQSITDGVDFRFAEVRSCAYQLLGARDGAKIFERRQVLDTNFRSHDGIIQTANQVLDWLYAAFPGALDKMNTQTGLATGPKPGLMPNATLDDIVKMISIDPKLRVLT